MSEFDTNPEAALRAEQSALETNLTNLNEQLASMQEGKKRDNRTQEESDRITALATFTKRELFRVLTELHDIVEIAHRLDAEIYSQKQAMEDEEMPVYAEIVFEDTFGTEVDDPKVHEDIHKILHGLAKEHEIATFFDEE
jgi:hypothetical protein